MENNAYEVIALLPHDDTLKTDLFQNATIAIVAVESSEEKSFETIRYLKEGNSLKVLALLLHLKKSIVFKSKILRVEGLFGTILYEALHQI